MTRLAEIEARLAREMEEDRFRYRRALEQIKLLRYRGEPLAADLATVALEGGE